MRSLLTRISYMRLLKGKAVATQKIYIEWFPDRNMLDRRSSECFNKEFCAKWSFYSSRPDTGTEIYRIIRAMNEPILCIVQDDPSTRLWAVWRAMCVRNFFVNPHVKHVGELCTAVIMRVAQNLCGKWRFMPAILFHPPRSTNASLAKLVNFSIHIPLQNHLI